LARLTFLFSTDNSVLLCIFKVYAHQSEVHTLYHEYMQ